MNTVIKQVDGGYEFDDELGDVVVRTLARNNTFFPNVTQVFFSTSPADGTDGSRDVLTTVVKFADGTSSVVKNRDRDEVKLEDRKVQTSAGEITVRTADRESMERGIAYALVKRLFCKFDKKGVSDGKGLVRFLDGLLKEARVAEVEKAVAKAEAEKARDDAAKAAAKAAEPKKSKKNLAETIQELSQTLAAFQAMLAEKADA